MQNPWNLDVDDYGFLVIAHLHDIHENHAIPFMRGAYSQGIDANQDTRSAFSQARFLCFRLICLMKHNTLLVLSTKEWNCCSWTHGIERMWLWLQLILVFVGVATCLIETCLWHDVEPSKSIPQDLQTYDASDKFEVDSSCYPNLQEASTTIRRGSVKMLRELYTFVESVG